MQSTDLFQRLSIPTLVEIVGESELESIQDVLQLIDPQLYTGTVYTKGFLSNFAFKTVGYKYLNSNAGFKTIFNTLTVEEARVVCGIDAPGSSKEDCLKTALTLFRNGGARGEMFERMGFHFYLQAANLKTDSQSSSITISASKYPYKQLKDYQFEVYIAASDALKSDYERFILQMPTGSGKTRTAMEIVSNFLNTGVNASVIWLAHSTELCDQASQCFLELAPHITHREIFFQRSYGSYKMSREPSKKTDFLCLGFQTAYGAIVRDPNFLDGILNDRRLIVIDEAHKAIAPTYQRVLKAIESAPGTRIMGLTATPGRRYTEFNTENENAALAKFFFEKIFSFNTSGKGSIQYLRDRRILANAECEMLIVNGSVSLTSSELKRVSEVLEIPPAVLEKIGTNSIRNAEILSRLRDLAKSEATQSIIFFAASVTHSMLISSMLSFLGIRAEHIDGTTPAKRRSDAINLFRRKEIRVLCNYEVLATGFDAPKIDCVFIARPTASVVLYSQMIGRGLRGPAIGGTEKCLIVNVKDNFTNLPQVEKMYDVFEDYWKYSN